jgi:pimeloyl-ACP methyl ester carboxylesterase
VASSHEKSTTVRTEKRAARSAQEVRIARMRPVFGVLERVAPWLGARLAWKAWSTPTRPNAQAVARSREGGTGELRMLRIELPDWTGRRPTRRDGTPKPPRTTEIAVELLGPEDGPLVYLLHGWGGWRGQFAPIGRRLAASGHRVVLIDGPNHGDSGPGAFGRNQGLLPDFSLTLTAVAREFGPAHAILGHSLGAACTADALLDGVKADKVVFLAPPIDPLAFTRYLAGALGFGERIRTRMVRIPERRSGIHLADFVLPPKLVGRTDLPPALVVHDVQDAVIPIATGRVLAESWPDTRMIETSGLGHNRILRDPATVEAVAAFVESDALTPRQRERQPRSCGVDGASMAGTTPAR